MTVLLTVLFFDAENLFNQIKYLEARRGSWYSYRASKAALNMLLKTAAIEVKRSKPQAVLVSLHPGTVNTGLSKPFKGEQIGRPALSAVQDMLATLNQLTAADSGTFVAYNGERLPW
jgi:NAD(P)-dependent dehydrogenase (short-subunit alcohol dehydrogenase family)